MIWLVVLSILLVLCVAGVVWSLLGYRKRAPKGAATPEEVVVQASEPQIPAPPIVVTILDSGWENWQHKVMLATLEVEIANTTAKPIRLAHLAIRMDGGAPTSEENVQLGYQEAQNREANTPHPVLSRRISTLPAYGKVTGSVISVAGINPEGGTPRIRIEVRDEIGNVYRATLPAQQPKVHDF